MAVRQQGNKETVHENRLPHEHTRDFGSERSHPCGGFDDGFLVRNGGEGG